MTQKNDEESNLQNVENEKQIKRRKIVSVISFLLMIVFFAVITIAVGKPLLAFVSNSEKFRLWVNSQGAWGYLTLIGIMRIHFL